MNILFGSELGSKETPIQEEVTAQQISDELLEKMDELEQQMKNIQKGNGRPHWTQKAQIVVLFLGLGVVFGIMKIDVGFAEGFRQAPWLYLGVVACVLVWLGLGYWKKRNRITEKSIAEQQLIPMREEMEQLRQQGIDELCIPEEAQKADVLFFRYVLKHGEPELKPMMGNMDCVTSEMKVYRENGCLCIANSTSKFAIPMEDIISIEPVKKLLTAFGWNKDGNFLEERYSVYGLQAKGVGFTFPEYEILHFKAAGKECQMWFPNYELPVFEPLIEKDK